MPKEKINNWREVIKLNLNCGCKLGICKKCAPIIQIIQDLLKTQAEDNVRIIQGIKR